MHPTLLITNLAVIFVVVSAAVVTQVLLQKKRREVFRHWFGHAHASGSSKLPHTR